MFVDPSCVDVFKQLSQHFSNYRSLQFILQIFETDLPIAICINPFLRDNKRIILKIFVNFTVS